VADATARRYGTRPSSILGAADPAMAAYLDGCAAALARTYEADRRPADVPVMPVVVWG